jgi:FkbM family methyltransferase
MAVFVESLKKSGHLDDIHMTLCNVGSRKLGTKDDLGTQGWDIFAPQLTIYGFDADADPCDEANADLEARQVNWTEQHIALALGKSVGESTLYVTKHPMCSSLYPPNEPYLKRFGGMIPELMNLDFTIEIETTTLDEFFKKEGVDKIDFLQTDVQGADLDVLGGSIEMLENSILAVKSEVLFDRLYIGSPLFADVDQFMRSKGFTLFSLATAYRPRSISPIVSNKHSGQLLWGDAFYIRDVIHADESIISSFKTPDTILKLACIADLMDFPDYALEILEYLTLTYGNEPNYNCAKSIIDSLSQFPDLVKKGLGSFPVVQRIRDYVGDYNFDSLTTP